MNSSFEGINVNPPSSDANGNNYLIDDINTNNWRELRIINETHNWIYIEIVNHTWDKNAFENPYFFELYNASGDIWNINNIYDSINNETKKELHEMLLEYGSCSGEKQCP